VKFYSTIFLFILFFNCACLNAQVKFSLSSDVSVLHNFDGKQKFTVVGQSLIAQWHTDKKVTLYSWFTYHANGKYSSKLIATAKSPATQPQTISFTNNSEMRLRQLSLGVKKYFIGSYESLERFNLYGGAGFGLIIGTASNNFSNYIDTSLYTIQNNVVNGSGDFKRLTLDVLGGVEFPVSYEIFVYTEVRMHIPTTNYPNSYLLKNSNAPFLAGINLGLRILFNADP
jgi:opacity protein-like surface antigen